MMMNDDDGAFLIFEKSRDTHERDAVFFPFGFFEKNENFRRERRPSLSALSLSFVHMNNPEMNHHVSCTSHTL